MANERPRRPITIFSVLALVVLLAGVAAVLYFRFFTIDTWINSGDKLPIGLQRGGVLDLNTETPEGTVELAPGPHVVFYESPVGVPQDAGMIVLNIRAPDGAVLHTRLFFDDEGNESYGPRPFLSFTNMSGKPFWRIEAPTAGTYTVFAKAEGEMYKDSGDDRVVFNKNPQTFSELNSRSTTIIIVLLGLTGGLFIVLYIAHGITLARRARESGQTGRPMVEPMD